MKYSIGGILLLLLAGCASTPDGKPTITLDAEVFVASYIAERDEFRDRTFLARLVCAQGKAADPSQCEALAAKQAVWAARDALVLKALLSRSPLDAETLKAAAAAGRDLLSLALRIAPIAGLAL